MAVSLAYDIGAYLKLVAGFDPLTVHSGSTQSGDPQFGRTIDRMALNRRYRSGKFGVMGVAVLAQATSTNGVAVGLVTFVQHSSDGSSWDAFSTDTAPAAGAHVLGVTTSATSTGAVGMAEQRVNLNGARRYIRGGVTASLSLGPSTATSTSNNVALSGFWALGGAEEVPVSSS